MNSDPILEEIWKIKDELARQAGYDMDRFFQNLQKWEADHPHAGPTVRNGEDLQKLIAQEERRRAQALAVTLKEEPPKPTA